MFIFKNNFSVASAVVVGFIGPVIFAFRSIWDAFGVRLSIYDRDAASNVMQSAFNEWMMFEEWRELIRTLAHWNVGRLMDGWITRWWIDVDRWRNYPARSNSKQVVEVEEEEEEEEGGGGGGGPNNNNNNNNNSNGKMLTLAARTSR